MEKQCEKFVAYAEQRLNEHQREISIRYQGDPNSREVVQNALKEHKEIFLRELDDLIREMVEHSNPCLSDLETLKKNYESVLS